MRSVGAMVLAAGLSRRMGEPKALLPLGGKAMVVRVVETLIAAEGIGPVIVVTGHQADQVAAAVSIYGVTCIHNPDYAVGEMISSVRCGIATLAGKVDAALLALGDQPAVQPETLRQLINARQDHAAPLVIPTFSGRRGHPLILSAVLFSEIQSLPPDQTLRDVVHRHLVSAILVPVDDPAVVADVDTPEDYQRTAQQWRDRTPGGGLTD